ncbi:MAG TPA: alpha/beta hydrolase [Lacipirellulaceae bacterium]|nr:alpha/beta hydrolase [Lacipirellulaceae bacterium]
MNDSGAPKFKKAARLSWRFARPLLIAYLLVVLAMVMLERWLVYPAPPRSAGDWHPTGFKYEDVWFQSADGTRLHGWFLPKSQPNRAILYCHGNGEDVASVGQFAAMLRELADASVFVFDYRGYGHSEGRPYEAGCIADGNAAQHWVAERMGIRPNEVVLMGRSLGSAIAIALAAKNGTRALVLENAFPTMTDVAAWHFPWLPVRWMMKNRYDNLVRIRQYHGPLLQSHGTADELVPLSFAQRLFDASPSKLKQWLELRGLDHNSPAPIGYFTQLRNFLDSAANSSHISENP